MLTSLASGFYSFATFRFLLGAGESANWPAATKGVSEWFPKPERALATALFDSGSSIGGAIAPFIVLWIYFRWGWRPAFMLPGILGFLWLIVWRWLYYPPEEHSRIGQAELEMIVADKQESDASDQGKARLRWTDLLNLPQTWGIIIAKASTDPVFFFITEWFPIYLVAKGIELKSGLIAVWIPFIAADLGSFFGGGISGYLIKRGWSLGAARKALIVFGGTGMTMLIPTIFTTNLYLIAVGKLNRRQILFFDLQDSDISSLIRTDQLRSQGTSIFQLHVDLIGAVDDVVVRDDITIGANNKARAFALIGLIAFTFGPTKEKVESRHRIIVGTKLAFLFDIDHHNRRRYFFVDRSVGIVQGMGDILCTIRSGRLGWKRS